MFLFIENLAGLHIATHSPELARRRLVKFVTPGVMAFAGSKLLERGAVFTLSPKWIRLLKPLLSLTQLPVIQQDPNSLAFRLGFWKHVLSDGLLTEFLVRELRVRVKHFYAMSSVADSNAKVVPGCAIIGSNWLEFGSMMPQAYCDHLQFLKRRYPDAIYYCHPKERNEWPERVFGATAVRRPDQPVEALLRATGVPCRLVGVCSSSLLALAAGNAGQVQVDVVHLLTQHYDGPRGDTVEFLKRPIDGRKRISVDDLQQFLVRELQGCQVLVHEVTQGTPAPHDVDLQTH